MKSEVRVTFQSESVLSFLNAEGARRRLHAAGTAQRRRLARRAWYTCQSLYSTQRAMLQHHGPQHGKTRGRWVQCSSTIHPPPHSQNVRKQWWEWHSVREFNWKAVGGAFGGLGGRAGALEKLLVGKGSCAPHPSSSHPFEIQVQGHEPREEWQRGPAPEQTGSHRAGLQSSSPVLAPAPLEPTPSVPGLRESGSRPPTDRPEPCAAERRVRFAVGFETEATSPREMGPAGDDGVHPLRRSFACTQASGRWPRAVCWRR